MVVTIGAPDNYEALLNPIPKDVRFTNIAQNGATFVHLFVTARKDLEKQLKRLRNVVASDGVVWTSWPKKSSGILSEVTEDVIREIALPLGMVDVKVCAIDETWSGLKLMIRREHRV